MNQIPTAQGADLRRIRLPFYETAKAYFSLSQTQRRLAHQVRRDALKWEALGNYQKFAACMLDGRRLWQDAKWHLERARMNRERAMK